MKKQKATIWMLLISTVLLGAFIFVFERDTESSYQREMRKRTLFAVYPDSIDKIILQRGDTLIECLKENGAWRMTKPVNAPVDADILRKMIAGMARAERGELITEETLRSRGLTTADYGFDEPRARITFENSRGVSTWLIGRDAPLGDSLYVMATGGGDIVSVPRTLFDLIPENSSWIRERALFDRTPAAVRGIDLHRESGFLQLRRQDNNSWKMLQPVAGRADLQAVHSLVEQILSGRITDFISDEKSDLTIYGLQSPVIELTLFTQDERTHTLQIGSTLPDQPGKRYARQIDSDSVFAVPVEWVSALNTDITTLRSRRLSCLPAEKVTAISLSRGDQQVELAKTNKQWMVIRPARWDADSSRVDKVLKSIAGASIQNFIDAPNAEQSARMDAALWKVVLSAEDQSCKLQFSAPGTNDLRMARSEGEPSLYAVPTETVQEAFVDPLFYRSRNVLEVNPAEIAKITVRTKTGEDSVEKSTDGTFVSRTENHTVNASALTDMMWALNDLQAEKYVIFNPESLDLYGLAQPQAELSVLLEGTNSIGHIVLLGAAAENGRFAMIQGRDTVFIIAEETAEVLTRRLVDAAKPLNSE